MLVADRIAWRPQSFFGDLGVDVGLWDRIVQRTRLTAAEHEAFYQLFMAISRVEPKKVARQAERDHVARQAGVKIELPGGKDQPSTALFIRDVTDKPSDHVGALGVITGTALRAELIRVDDDETRRRFGLDHYYQIDVPRTAGHSVRDPAAGQGGWGEEDDPSRRLSGRRLRPRAAERAFRKEHAFMRRSACRRRSSSSGESKAPRPPKVATSRKRCRCSSPARSSGSRRWTPRADEGRGGRIIAGLIALGVVIAALALWLVNRRDKQAEDRLIDKTTALAPGESLKDVPTFETSQTPDFDAIAAAAQRERDEPDDD